MTPVPRTTMRSPRFQRSPRGSRSFVARPHREERRAERPDTLVRFVPLGGLEEVGRNCSFFEYKNEIVVVDVGIQFPEEETPGVDYIIPNVSYLESRKQNITGIILTHGHYDHIAAIHYLIERLGNPIIYTAELTKEIVAKRHEEFTNAPKLNFHVVKPGDRVHLSDHIEAEFISVGHTIPDALGFILETPVGKMVSFGDFRLDVDERGRPQHTDVFEYIGRQNVHTIFLDSTNADREGFSLSERTVEKNIESLIKGAEGRVIIATFASLLTRIAEILKIAERLGRKVAVNGRSMRDNVEIAKRLGYLKVKKETFINLEDVNKHRDEKVLILSTGAQGEPNAGLMRIVSGEHRYLRLKDSDTVIFSSSVIPGNERSVQALQDNIARQANEVYNSRLLDIHVSGHAYQEDLKLVMKLTKPKFVVPIHSHFFRRTLVKKLAKEVGIEHDRVVLMDNGQVAELTRDTFRVTDQKVPSFYVMVDGLGIGDVEEVVLRDRRNLAQEGMIVAIVTLDRRNGRLLKNPDIISRGFIYMKENQVVLEEIRKRVRGIVSRLPSYQEVETDYVKTLIRDQIGQFVHSKIRRRPMIIPVVIEI